MTFNHIRPDLGLGEIIESIMADVEAMRVVWAWLNLHNVGLLHEGGAWRIGRVKGETRPGHALPAYPTLAQAMQAALDHVEAQLRSTDAAS